MTAHIPLKKSSSLGHFFKRSHHEEEQQNEVEPTAEELMQKDVSLTAFFGPFMKNYAATLSSSKGNPGKIPYPPQFYIPQSSLQHTMTSKLKHIGLLEFATQQPDPMNRFLAVLKYFFSTVNLTKFPYKPIIAMEGETSHYFVGRTCSIGEEIVHDPPHAAFHITNADKGFSYDGNIVLEPHFSKGSVRVKLNGFNKITLQDPQGRFNEVYDFGNPDLLIRMLRMLTECVGDVQISCASTGYSARITFKEKSLFGGTKNAITGTVSFQNKEVGLLDGVWDESVFITDLSNQVRTEFVNRRLQPADHVECPPFETLPETAGDRVWAPFVEMLKKEMFMEAQTWKLDNNAKERAERAQRRANGVQPANFVKNPSTGWWEVKSDPSLMHPCGKNKRGSIVEVMFSNDGAQKNVGENFTQTNVEANGISLIQ